ncbi:MAG TPA: hypothetical protein DCZ92_13015 [Elusimicrobia bacterium]|nr:MAG: hypothetical protein A2016_00710 [Elusimicrobia bacterium GWF2_62_30]HBA61705.1 hypothetical protein [Elusimicrobiota bacterium]
MADIDVKEYFTRFKSFFTEMTDTMMAIYAEKGMAPFKKPLTITVPLILVIYVLVYNPLSSKIENGNVEIQRGRAIAESAGDYQDSRSRLAGFQRKLPPLKEKDDWLNSLLASTAKNHNISFDAITEQTEEESGNFLLVYRQVQFTSDYATVGKWLAEVENTSNFLRIVALVVNKDPESGRVKVTIKLSTIFPKKGGVAI